MQLARLYSASLAAVAALSFACAGGAPPQKFEELPSAEELFNKGETQLAAEESGFHWFLTPDFSESIETF